MLNKLITLRHHPLLHFNYFWVLVLLLPATFYILIFYRHTGLLVFQTMMVNILIYLGMALMHHHVHKNLTLEIALEYVLTAALALIILQSLLL